MVIVVSRCTVGQGRGVDDYWREDYDQSQNCVMGKRITELRAKVDFIISQSSRRLSDQTFKIFDKPKSQIS